MKTFAIGNRVTWKGLSGTIIAIVFNIKEPTKQEIVRIEWDDKIISSIDAQQRGLKVIKNDKVTTNRSTS